MQPEHPSWCYQDVLGSEDIVLVAQHEERGKLEALEDHRETILLEEIVIRG